MVLSIISDEPRRAALRQTPGDVSVCDDVFLLRRQHPNRAERRSVGRSSGCVAAGRTARLDGNTDGRRADGADVRLIPTTPRSVTIAANCGPAVLSRRRRPLYAGSKAAS